MSFHHSFKLPIAGGARSEESAGQCRRHKRSRFDSWVRKLPWRRDRLPTPVFLGFPGGLDGKESACNVGDLVSIPELGRSPGRGHGNPLQYSCLENPMDRGAWWAIVRGVAKSWTWLKRLRTTAQPWHSRLALLKGVLRCIKEHCRLCLSPCLHFWLCH